jgi:site-specific recombinase XerD
MIMKNYSIVSAISDYFNNYLPNECGVSKKTIENYTYAFQLFFIFMRDEKQLSIEKIELNDITKNNIIDFLRWLESNRKCSTTTRNNRLATFCSFARFLQYRNIQNLSQWHEILTIKRKNYKNKEVIYIKEPGIKEILKIPDPKTKFGLRDLAFLSLLYDTGCRVSEIINLTPSSIHFDEITTVRVLGKGNKVRYIPISKNEAAIIRKYMETNSLLLPENSCHPLFPNRQGFIMTRMSAWNIVQKYVSMAREKKPELIPQRVGCHTFRHSKAMHMLEAKAHMEEIRDILGHSSVTTTEIYARASEKLKQEALEKVSPGIIPKGKTTWQKNKGLLSLLLKLRLDNEG